MLPIINNNRLDRTDRCTISPTSYTSTGHLSRQAAGEERGLLRLVRHETRPADQLEPIDAPEPSDNRFREDAFRDRTPGVAKR